MIANVDAMISLVLIGFSLFFMYLTKGLEGRADFFPMIVLVCLLAASVFLFLQSRRMQEKAAIPISGKLVALVVASFVYVFIMNTIGYVLSTGLFFMSLLLINKYSKKFVGLIISFGFAYAIFFFFSRILAVPLPTITDWF